MYFQVFFLMLLSHLLHEKLFADAMYTLNQTDKNIECDVLSGPTPTRPIRY